MKVEITKAVFMPVMHWKSGEYSGTLSFWFQLNNCTQITIEYDDESPEDWVELEIEIEKAAMEKIERFIQCR